MLCIPECAKIPLVNGVVQGNTFSIGDTVGLVCNRQFSNSLAIRLATCQENESWTQYSNCTLGMKSSLVTNKFIIEIVYTDPVNFLSKPMV
jgi:hypothetical protein